MTALDQAFIRAFNRQDTTPLGSLARTLPANKPSPVHSEPISQLPLVDDKVVSEMPASSLPMGRSFANGQTVPLSATLDGVLAALGRSPKSPASVAVEETVPEVQSEVELALRPLSSIPPVVGARDLNSLCFSTSTDEEIPALPANGRPAVSAAIEENRTFEALNPPQVAAKAVSLPHPAKEAYVERPVTEMPQTFLRDLPEKTPEPLLPGPHEFQPAWQVDQFTWPKVCRKLIARAATELDRLADALLAAHAQGQRVLAISGCRRGEGATTLLLCAARRLAERGLKPVLVDADLVCPKVAKRLGLQPQVGWNETSGNDQDQLHQAVIEATANNVAVVPVREPAEGTQQPRGDLSRLPGCVRMLQDHYDLVLVDLGPLTEMELSESTALAEMFDSIILVHNDRLTAEEQLFGMVDQLAHIGVAVSGIVENFVPEV